MAWYNPLTWFTPDWAEGVTQGEANSYRLLMQAEDEYKAGIITYDDYLAIRAAYTETYGAVPGSMAEAVERGQSAYDEIINTRTAQALAELPKTSGLNTITKVVIGGVVLMALLQAVPVFAPHVKRALKAIK